MKYLCFIISVLLFCSFAVASDDSPAFSPNVNWDQFSVNLVKAIKSGHPGLQQSAMQRIIQYSDKLDVKDAVYDIALIFRYDDNPAMRRMALVTLYKIGTDHSVSYLCQNMKFEENDSVKRQCCQAIQRYIADRNVETSDKVVLISSK
jgi:hypothetical protein